jgi:phosphoadenosine phosphosulfate reductase
MAEQLTLEGFNASARDAYERALARPLEEKVDLALALLREYEPAALKLQEKGYWLAFSGGKDSVVLQHLARRAGVRWEAHYSNTTIDPPELLRYMREEHPHVVWSKPEKPLLRVVESVKGPPTRLQRWCCERYKEAGGRGWVRLIGVRAEESPRRAALWPTIKLRRFGDHIVSPILYWTEADVWTYARAHALRMCPLYEEGFRRLGCIGCPMAGHKGMAREFARWPGYARAWKRAVCRHWELWHAVPTQAGEARHTAGFASGEEYWQWWFSNVRRTHAPACDGLFGADQS